MFELFLELIFMIAISFIFVSTGHPRDHVITHVAFISCHDIL